MTYFLLRDYNIHPKKELLWSLQDRRSAEAVGVGIRIMVASQRWLVRWRDEKEKALICDLFTVASFGFNSMAPTPGLGPAILCGTDELHTQSSQEFVLKSQGARNVGP